MSGDNLEAVTVADILQAIAIKANENHYFLDEKVLYIGKKNGKMVAVYEDGSEDKLYLNCYSKDE